MVGAITLSYDSTSENNKNLNLNFKYFDIYANIDYFTTILSKHGGCYI